MKAIIPNIRRFTTGIHAISRIFKISLAAENNIWIVKDTFVFPAVFLIKISYHFHLYLSCPTNLRRSPEISGVLQRFCSTKDCPTKTWRSPGNCSYFVRQTFVLQKRSSGKLLPENCPTELSDSGIDFYIYKVCPTKVTLQSQTFSNFVRQSSVLQKRSSGKLLPENCPTAPKKGGKLQLLTLPG